MISFYNTQGQVSMTGDFFSQLITTATQDSFGVAGMADKSRADNLRRLFVNDTFGRGVQVTDTDGMLTIDLHIKVTYGLNIAAAVQSITHKVQYVVEETTGLKVRRINVSVDDVEA